MKRATNAECNIFGSVLICAQLWRLHWRLPTLRTVVCLPRPQNIKRKERSHGIIIIISDMIIIIVTITLIIITVIIRGSCHRATCMLLPSDTFHHNIWVDVDVIDI